MNPASLLVGLGLGVLASLIAAIIYEWVWPYVNNRSAPPPFSLTGLWAARFLPVSPPGTEGIELVWISQRGARVKFAIENYNSNREPVKLKGLGICQSFSFSGFYFFTGAKKPHTGTFTFRILTTGTGDPVLSGSYSEVVHRNDVAKATISCQPYELSRIHPAPSRGKHHSGYSFASYADADNFLKTSAPHLRLPEASTGAKRLHPAGSKAPLVSSGSRSEPSSRPNT